MWEDAGMDRRPGPRPPGVWGISHRGGGSGGGKNESVGGTVPRVLATEPSLGIATLNPQGPLWFTLWSRE